MGCFPRAHTTHSARAGTRQADRLFDSTMDSTIKIALVGTGMFGGDVHARAYAALQRAGISPHLARRGMDEWARDFFLIMCQPPRSTPFPYTTLFRSGPTST